MVTLISIPYWLVLKVNDGSALVCQPENISLIHEELSEEDLVDYDFICNRRGDTLCDTLPDKTKFTYCWDLYEVRIHCELLA